MGINKNTKPHNKLTKQCNLNNNKTNAFGKSNWSNCVGAISYKGNVMCIGRDWGTGELSAKNGWKYTQKQNTTWREAKMMVKIGGMGYALGHNYICQIDLE